MTNRALATVSAVVIAASSGLLSGQKPAAAKPEKQQVVVIGASVSFGFEDLTSRHADGSVNRSYRLDAVLKKVWDRDAARIRNRGDLMMFMNSKKRGRAQVDFAKQVKPDLVVGVDFPFWFGYGGFGRAAKGEVNANRMAAQKNCFRMLEELKCPIVVGDYPDMSGASTKMLPRSMIPNKATIAALNAEVRKWAKSKANVTVLSLSEFVKDAVSKPQTYAYGKGTVVFPKNFLLQSDRLHASRLGMCVLTEHLLDTLPMVLPKQHPLLASRPGLKGLVEAFPGLDEKLPPPPVKKKGKQKGKERGGQK